jgi:DNA-binding NarL/FixJ family response regulator
MTKIFLIDDHPAVRQGLKLVLSRDTWAICGEAGGVSETKERIGFSGADIAIVDLSLSDGDGFELIARLREKFITVLVYSMHEDAATIEKAFTAGANAYVSKRDAASVLLDAVSTTLSEGRYVSPRVAQILASKALAPQEPEVESALTEREIQILVLLGRGESNADIASALFISVRTVETYYARIIAKLQLSGMKELRRYAIRKPEQAQQQ